MSRVLSLLLIGAICASAEVEDSIPLGIEAVTGFRSNYFDRGIELADASLDFQIESEIALSNQWFLSLGAWHLSESSGDFSETALSLESAYEFSSAQFLTGLLYRDADSSILESGIEIHIGLMWFLSDDLSFSTKLAYDDGAESFYGQARVSYSKVINEESYWSLETGFTAASDFYSIDGVVDYFGRLSLTYNVNSQISVTPFVGFSSSPSDETFAASGGYAGLWFAVSF